MAIQDHYLTEDLDQLTDHLENLYNACMGILESAMKADFTSTDKHQETIQQSIQVILALHNRKLKHDELNN